MVFNLDLWSDWFNKLFKENEVMIEVNLVYMGFEFVVNGKLELFRILFIDIWLDGFYWIGIIFIDF